MSTTLGHSRCFCMHSIKCMSAVSQAMSQALGNTVINGSGDKQNIDDLWL